MLIELAEQSEREHDIHYSEVINFLKKYNYQIFEVDKNLKQFNRDLKFNEIINIFIKKKNEKISFITGGGGYVGSVLTPFF